jgi:uncharacterized membrane protein
MLVDYRPGKLDHILEAVPVSPTSLTDTVGPVDIAIVLFEGNEFNGDVAPAIAELQQNGTVRIIDLAFVVKDTEGNAAVLELADATIASAFEAITQESFELLSQEELDELAESLEPNSSALVIVWENTWAARLGAAVRGSNGQVVVLERIPREAVVTAIAALGQE